MNVCMEGGFLRSFGSGMLKSTQDRMERQQQTKNQVEFFENQKANLKNMVCENPEEIMRKLDMLHSYEDQIAAVKAAYNNEQMYHLMDEAKETGEKIAEAAEDSKPKTKEERKEDLVEEAMGVEEEDGMLSEIMDELDETLKVMEELEAAKETLPDEDMEKLLEEGAKKTLEEGVELTENRPAAETENIYFQAGEMPSDEKNHIYRPFDIKI